LVKGGKDLISYDGGLGMGHNEKFVKHPLNLPRSKMDNDVRLEEDIVGHPLESVLLSQELESAIEITTKHR
jgi:hypothetical protein